MKKSWMFIFTIMVLFIAGCGGVSNSVSLVSDASTEIVEMEPDWYSNLAPREGYVMGKAEGVSRDKSGARMKAQNMLINDFRQKTKVVAEGRSSNFFKETGEDLDSKVMQTFSSTQNSIWNGAVENWLEFKSITVVEKTTDNQGRKRNIYRHYMIGGVDKAAADKQLLAAINREKELMTAFEATKAYEQLQDDLERYKEKLD